MEEREIALVETKKFTILIAINHAYFSSRFAGFFFLKQLHGSQFLPLF